MKHFLFIIFLLTLIFSCKDKHPNKPKVVSAATAIKSISTIDGNTPTAEEQLIKFDSKYSFETFKAKLFTGKTASPDFTNNEFSSDKEYLKFITDGCNKNAINFGGHFTIIQRSCGAMCEHIFIVDRITGKIYTDIRPYDGHYGYLYKRDSYLLIANSNSFQDDSLKYYSNLSDKPELFVWKGNNFHPLN